jgi:hypothetical protein
MPKIIELLFYLFIFLISPNFIKSQISVLGPPSVVQKVKELEDGSKKKKT